MKTYLGEAKAGSSMEPIVRQIEALLGNKLLGVLLFGSEARGEARESSDRDLLIVVEHDLPLTRTLYSRWDLSFPEASTSMVSPHFVHLPPDPAAAGSIWCEAALDGVILFERDRGVFNLLRAIRRQMAEGRLRRRSAYGHPYWVSGGEEAERPADYVKRAGSRLRALEVLMKEKSWADVVREAQEIVEITLKALLRACRIEVPRIHDVSPVLLDNRELLPPEINAQLEELVKISRTLRRDRELAFYGSEDLTPSEFYKEEDAATALNMARTLHEAVRKALARREP